MNNLSVIRQKSYDRMICFKLKPPNQPKNGNPLTKESERLSGTDSCDFNKSYTVEAVAMGLAHYLEVSQVNYKDRSVIILYDDAAQSRAYALNCATMLGAMGIKVNIFHENKPAVLLSYAIRYFGAAGGIRIVANGNTEWYLYGVEIYNESGSRITERDVTEIETHIQQTSAANIKSKQEIAILERENILAWINGEIENAYLDRLDSLSGKVLLTNANKDIAISISTDNKVTLRLLEKALIRNNFKNIIKTSETELKKTHAAEIHLETNGAELFITAKKNSYDHEVLLDEMLVALLTDYIVNHSDKHFLPNARIIKTEAEDGKRDNFKNVNRRLPHIKTIETAPGFHHICERIRMFDQTGETFLFGYDGNGGFLVDDFVRGKDGIQMAVIICEMAQYYKNKRMTLLEAYQSLSVNHPYNSFT